MVQISENHRRSEKKAFDMLHLGLLHKFWSTPCAEGMLSSAPTQCRHVSYLG